MTYDNSWRSIPGYNKYLMNADKQIINAATGKELATFHDKRGGSARVALYDDSMVQVTLNVHRLYCTTFDQPYKRPYKRRASMTGVDGGC